jgi:toxin YoeB
LNVVFLPIAFDQYFDWQQRDRGVTGKINRLIEECRRHPFQGSGKPEPLQGNYSGYWSRRIDREHRLVYRVEGANLIIIQCRYHY